MWWRGKGGEVGDTPIHSTCTLLLVTANDQVQCPLRSHTSVTPTYIQRSYLWMRDIAGFSPSSRFCQASFLFVILAAAKSFFLPLPHIPPRIPGTLSAPIMSATNNNNDDAANCGHLYGFGVPNHKPSILQTITAQRYEDVRLAQAQVPSSELEARIAAFDQVHGPPLNLFERIRADDKPIALAAEFKRASPSKGDIALDLVAAEQGIKYSKAGAAILSVLTEPKWFKGSLQDMEDVRVATEKGLQSSRSAVLRKDFVLEEYQLLEARAHGADTVLLIVAILEVDRLQRLIKTSRMWGMEPLVEVNTLPEMEIALDAGAKVIGVNNRNLHTFQLDLGTTERVMEAARKRSLSWDKKRGDILLAALSGISARADVVRYERAGVSVVLIGETLMRAADPLQAVRELLGLEDSARGSNTLIKVCGITRVEDAMVATRAGTNLIGTIFCASKRKVTGEGSAAVVQAVRKFGERTKRVLPYVEEIVDTAGAGALAPMSPEWFAHWQKELLRVTRRTPLVVGVFQNNSVEEVAELVEASGIDLIQLHGDETIGFAREISKKTGVPCIKVVHVPHDAAAATAEGLGKVLAGLQQEEGGKEGGPIALLLDTSVGNQKGGSGAKFDWSLAAMAQAQGFPVIVAGGLLPENVEEALSVAQPFGVDVSSGVEASPGVKEGGKVTDFIRRVRTFK